MGFNSGFKGLIGFSSQPHNAGSRRLQVSRNMTQIRLQSRTQRRKCWNSTSCIDITLSKCQRVQERLLRPGDTKPANSKQPGVLWLRNGLSTHLQTSTLVMKDFVYSQQRNNLKAPTVVTTTCTILLRYS